MQKGLLVLNQDLSGINRFLVESLGRCGWDVRVADVGWSPARRLLLAARTLHPHRGTWRRRFHRALGVYGQTESGTAARTAAAAAVLRRRARPGDLVLAIGVHFDPDRLTPRRDYVVFKDFTTALAARADRRFLDLPSANEFQRWIAAEAHLCRGAALILSASDNTRRSLIDDYAVPPERVVTVGEGLCFDDLPPPPDGKRYDSPTVLFIGKDFERKGGDTLLEAFAAVRRRLPAAELVVVGPEDRRAVPAGVQWLGLVPDRSRVQGLLERSTVFAMPSRLEPFGLVFLEAMAHGLPCLGTRRDAMPEIVADGVTGFLVEPGDATALAEKIVLLLGDADLARRMGRAGYDRVVSRFRWSDVARRMDAALARLLPDANPRTSTRDDPAPGVMR